LRLGMSKTTANAMSVLPSLQPRDCVLVQPMLRLSRWTGERARRGAHAGRGAHANRGAR
jgi:hypothetical protein